MNPILQTLRMLIKEAYHSEPEFTLRVVDTEGLLSRRLKPVYNFTGINKAILSIIDSNCVVSLNFLYKECLPLIKATTKQVFSERVWKGVFLYTLHEYGIEDQSIADILIGTKDELLSKGKYTCLYDDEDISGEFFVILDSQSQEEKTHIMERLLNIDNYWYMSYGYLSSDIAQGNLLDDYDDDDEEAFDDYDEDDDYDDDADEEDDRDAWEKFKDTLDEEDEVDK